MLKTERNTANMEKRVLRAFRKWGTSYRRPRAYFEHGQWWVIADDPSEDTEATFSVQDAEGAASWIVDGFCFEEA